MARFRTVSAIAWVLGVSALLGSNGAEAQSLKDWKLGIESRLKHLNKVCFKKIEKQIDKQKNIETKLDCAFERKILRQEVQQVLKLLPKCERDCPSPSDLEKTTQSAVSITDTAKEPSLRNSKCFEDRPRDSDTQSSCSLNSLAEKIDLVPSSEREGLSPEQKISERVSDYLKESAEAFNVIHSCFGSAGSVCESNLEIDPKTNKPKVEAPLEFKRGDEVYIAKDNIKGTFLGTWNGHAQIQFSSDPQLTSCEYDINSIYKSLEAYEKREKEIREALNKFLKFPGHFSDSFDLLIRANEHEHELETQSLRAMKEHFEKIEISIKSINENPNFSTIQKVTQIRETLATRLNNELFNEIYKRYKLHIDTFPKQLKRMHEAYGTQNPGYFKYPDEMIRIYRDWNPVDENQSKTRTKK